MIKIVLDKQVGVIINFKKIRRLMNKCELYCPNRKANAYKRMAKAIATSDIAPNVVNRKFDSVRVL
ncbi:MAG: hypothetical protein ACRCTA_00055 [Bacilli bacterium]